jgi:hypothetical protein
MFLIIRNVYAAFVPEMMSLHTSLHRPTISLSLSIYGSTALCWALSAFLVSWSFTQSVALLGRGISPSQGRYLHTGLHKHRINACLEWDSNPGPPCLSGQSQFMPYTWRPLWSAGLPTTVVIYRRINCAETDGGRSCIICSGISGDLRFMHIWIPCPLSGIRTGDITNVKLEWKWTYCVVQNFRFTRAQQTA